MPLSQGTLRRGLPEIGAFFFALKLRNYVHLTYQCYPLCVVIVGSQAGLRYEVHFTCADIDVSITLCVVIAAFRVPDDLIRKRVTLVRACSAITNCRSGVRFSP